MTEAEETKVLRELERRGWQRTEVQHRLHPGYYYPEYPPYWWQQSETDTWVLESIWPPLGLRAWLEFRRYPRQPDRDLTVQLYPVQPGEGVKPLLLLVNGLSPLRVMETLAEWRGQCEVEPMQADDWVGERDIRCVLELASKRVSERKLRLFACACWRHFPFLLENENNQAALEAEEEYADGLINKRELRKVRKATSIPWLTSHEAHEEAQQTILAFLRLTPQARHSTPRELLCEVLWDPWKPVPALKPSWLLWNDRTVARMAQAIYEEHRFEELAILADALEDAGCSERVILDHLRSPGPHARGCWAVDALLGKQ
jgi:hypothetical protein